MKQVSWYIILIIFELCDPIANLRKKKNNKNDYQNNLYVLSIIAAPIYECSNLKRGSGECEYTSLLVYLRI